MYNQLSGIWMLYSFPKIIPLGRCKILFMLEEKQNCQNYGRKSKKCMNMAQTPAAKAGDMLFLKKKLNKFCSERTLMSFPRKRSPNSRKKICPQNFSLSVKYLETKRWIGSIYLNFIR